MSSEQDDCAKHKQQQPEERLTSIKSAKRIACGQRDNNEDKDTAASLKRASMSQNGLTKQAAQAATSPIAPTHSRIVNFYSGRSVLVTGASGFLGKLLIEKLLRTCSDLKQIYVLIRPRRNKSASERFNELFNSIIFNTLRAQLGSSSSSSNNSNSNNNNNSSSDHGGSEATFNRFVRDRITLLEGDLTEPLLGLKGQQLSELASEVSVVLHSAAIVSFDGKLRRSIQTNLRGTYQALQVACKLPKLVSFVHVSTCYSNCNLSKIDEHIYPVNVDPMNVLDMAECFDDGLVELLRERLLGPHPNPYTYTKQLCEHLCGQYAISKALPVLICRPSIVISTLEEPMRGFVDNRNGANGLHDAIGRGVLRVAPGTNTALADMVPADLVVNCIIALGWFADQYHKVRFEIEPEVAAVAMSGARRGGFCNGTAGTMQSKDCVVDSGDDDKNGYDDDAAAEAAAAADAKLVRLKMITYYETRKARLAKKFELDHKPEGAAPASVDMPGLRTKGRDTIGTSMEQLCQVPVVHVSSGMENPITFKRMCNYVAEGARKYPSGALFREPKFTLVPVGLRYKLWRFYQQTLVATLMDMLARLMVTGPTSAATPTPANPSGQPSSYSWTKEFERVDRFVGVLPYFLSNSWYFNPESKLTIVREFMTEEDRRLFNCNSAIGIDWRSFGHEIALGMRRYIYGESDESLEATRANYNRTYWRNTLVQLTLTSVLGYLSYIGLCRLRILSTWWTLPLAVRAAFM